MKERLSAVWERCPDVYERLPAVWERCPVTKKIEICPANLWKLRAMVGVGAFGVGYAGSYALPFWGFDPTGVTANSLAAGWQATIGNVAAGSTFASWQSLGATGTGALLFGGATGGLTLLAGLVAGKKLDWCACQYERGMYTKTNL